MQGTTHMAIGFMTGAAVASSYHVPLSVETGAVAMMTVVGSLLPDIDHPASRISHDMKCFALPFHLFSHRGLTHSLLAVVVMALLMGFLQVEFVRAVALLAGYVSHLIADALTRSGIRLWWPSRRRFRILPKALS